MSAAVATRRPAKKPVARPVLKIVDHARGQYAVSSRTYGGHIFYLVDVPAGTCECTGNATCGKVCRHLTLATAYYKAFRPKAAPGPVLGPVPVVPVASPALVSRYGGAAGLMEAFGS